MGRSGFSSWLNHFLTRWSPSAQWGLTTHASQRTGRVRSRVSKFSEDLKMRSSPVLLETIPMAQCPVLGSPDCVLLLYSGPPEGARQAQRSPLAQNRAGTLSFLTFGGSPSLPETPILTLGRGYELAGCGQHGATASTSRLSPPSQPPLSLEQSLPPGPLFQAGSGLWEPSVGPPGRVV